MRQRSSSDGPVRSMIAIGSVNSAYRTGDYVKGLEATERLREGSSNTAQYCFFRGTMLHQLGRLEEAEASLREGLFLEEHSHLRALLSNTLATVLMDQERFAEAIDFYQLSHRTWKDRGASLRGIAEVWLRQGEFSRALEQARLAVDIDRRAEGMPKKILQHRLGEDLAVLAWALAATGSAAIEVEATLGQAFSLCFDSPTPVLALLNYQAGRAYMALKMADKSREHLNRAAEIDPQGICGKVARSIISWLEP